MAKSTPEEIADAESSVGVKLVGIGVLAIIAVFALLVLVSAFVIIPAGHRGVLLEWGAVVGEPKSEGIHLVLPIMQSMVSMDCQTQKYSTTAAAASKDLQNVNTVLAVNYHLDPSKAGEMYRTVGREYADRLIVPAVQEATKASTARFTAVELITDRNNMKAVIQEELGKRLLPYGVLVETVSIENFAFSASFDAAIETKVTQEQQTLTAQRKLEQIKFEAEQKVAAANGEAEAKLKIATAEAQAIKIQGDALRESPEIVQLRSVEKWDGKLPTMMLGNAMPMIQLNTTGY